MRSSADVQSSRPATRPAVGGKFLFVGAEKLWVRGATYGTFAPGEDGVPYPAPACVDRDFAAMRAAGPWWTGLTSNHWRILLAAFLGWIFDGYETDALISVLGIAIPALLPATHAPVPYYAGLALGLTGGLALAMWRRTGTSGAGTGLLESEMREHHIKWITSARIKKIEAAKMTIEEVADALELTPAYCYSVASFYDMFHLESVGKHTIEVCTNVCCGLVNAQAVFEAFQRELGVGPGETTADGEITLRAVECLGGCSTPTIVAGDHRYRAFVSPEDVSPIVPEARKACDRRGPSSPSPPRGRAAGPRPRTGAGRAPCAPAPVATRSSMRSTRSAASRTASGCPGCPPTRVPSGSSRSRCRAALCSCAGTTGPSGSASTGRPGASRRSRALAVGRT